MLDRRYRRRAPIAGVVSASLQPGHADGLSVLSQRRSSSLEQADLANAVFQPDDPDFPSWHGVRSTPDSATAAIDGALQWLRAANVPFLEVLIDPVLGKPRLVPLLRQLTSSRR